jgi:poly(hydroxyalkanoate) granule-associated protein
METLTTQVRKIQNEVADSAHKMFLAGLGAFALAEEEGARWFDRLVDRGRAVEKDGRAEVRKVQQEVGRARRKAEGRVEEWQEGMENQLGRLVERLGIPHRDQIRVLADRVEELTAKVEAVARGGAAAAPARKVYRLEPAEGGWSVKAEGNERATSTHATKDEALVAGRELAQRQAPSQLVVHRLDGTVQTAYAYEPEAVAS